MRTAGGGRDSRTGAERSSSTCSSSYRDRRDGGRSFGPYGQFQSNDSDGCQYGGAPGAGGQDPPPPQPLGPQPLMAQQFTLPQSMLGLMANTPFQFAPATGRK